MQICRTGPQGPIDTFFYTCYLTDVLIRFGNDMIKMKVIQITGTILPKIEITRSFTRPQAVPNLYDFLSSVEHKIRYFKECGCSARQ